MSADPLAPRRATVLVAGAPVELAYAEVPAPGPARGTVLYVHGFIASRRHWRPVVERLAAAGGAGRSFADQAAGRGVAAPAGGWRQLAVDLPGFGDSGSLPRPHRLEDYADALAALLAGLGERPVVVGHSFGGMVAVDLADRHPERVAGLVLVAPAGLPHPHHRIPGWVRVPLLADLLIALVTTRAVGRLYFARTMERLADLDPAWVKDLRYGVRRCREVRRMRAFYRMPHFLDALARLAVPAALIWGERDRVVPAADAEPILARLRSRPGRLGEVPFLLLPGVGHSPMHEDPDGFAAALRAALEAVTGQVSAPQAAEGRVRP